MQFVHIIYCTAQPYHIVWYLHFYLLTENK